ncbi:MAG: OmpW family outer membrane protein [Halopseudomonas sp.]|uniref:OmpW/AlkL family protein n=1 Tax=Halopseudomonas sp. TaxID=2901191 RepID=UPI00300225E4
MSRKIHHIASLLIAPALLAVSVSANAYQAGDAIIRLGAAAVDPQEDSGNVKIGGADSGLTVGVDSDVQLGLTGTYMLSDHLGIGLLAATPFQHSINLNGVGKLADIKHLPPTVTLQYFPLDTKSAVQPFVGAGINYTAFFDEEFTSANKQAGFSDLELDDSWGLALEAGVDYQLTEHLLLNASVWYADIDTEASFKVAGVNSSVDVDIDPFVYMLGLGYKF